MEPSRIDGLIPPGQARRVGVIPADGMGHARGSRRDDLLRDHGDQDRVLLGVGGPNNRELLDRGYGKPSFSKSQSVTAATGTTADCAGYFSPKLASISASVSTKGGQYWISDKPLTEEEWIAEFCTGARDDAQTLPILDSVQKLENRSA